MKLTDPKVDIITFSDGLIAKMKELTSRVDPHTEELPIMAKVLSQIRSHVDALREKLSSYEFKNQIEEIHFFKNAKPALLLEFYYYKKVLSIRLKTFYKSKETQQGIYRKSMAKLDDLVSKNKLFYEYYLMGCTNMDNVYFTRSGGKSMSVNSDIRFCASHDVLLAKLLSGALLKTFIERELEADSAGRSLLTWTGTKTDLTELIYALKAAGVFNNGKADIRQIANAFEIMCNSQLGDYYRTYQSILVRKGGQTSFLEVLQRSLIAKT